MFDGAWRRVVTSHTHTIVLPVMYDFEQTLLVWNTFVMVVVSCVSVVVQWSVHELVYAVNYISLRSMVVFYVSRLHAQPRHAMKAQAAFSILLLFVGPATATFVCSMTVYQLGHGDVSTAYIGSMAIYLALAIDTVAYALNSCYNYGVLFALLHATSNEYADLVLEPPEATRRRIASTRNANTTHVRVSYSDDFAVVPASQAVSMIQSQRKHEQRCAERSAVNVEAAKADIIDELQCAICLQDIRADGEGDRPCVFVRTPCLHVTHEDCRGTNAQFARRCEVCRRGSAELVQDI